MARCFLTPCDLIWPLTSNDLSIEIDSFNQILKSKFTHISKSRLVKINTRYKKKTKNLKLGWKREIYKSV